MVRRDISPNLMNPDWKDLSKLVLDPMFHLGMDDFFPHNFNFSTMADCGESSLSAVPTTKLGDTSGIADAFFSRH